MNINVSVCLLLGSDRNLDEALQLKDKKSVKNWKKNLMSTCEVVTAKHYHLMFYNWILSFSIPTVQSPLKIRFNAFFFFSSINVLMFYPGNISP